MSIMPCATCAVEFNPRNSRQRFCSDPCRYQAKDRDRFTSCAWCSQSMGYSGKHVAGKSMHQSCRVESTPHGPSKYRTGCRCDECKAGQAVKMAEYAQAYRADNGVHPTTAFRKAFRATNGYAYSRGSDWILPKLRLELYERDDWTCYLCESPVDRDGDPNGNRAPSLDHVMPRSKGGTHDPSNLKTACRSCNSRKGVTT